MIPRVLAPGLLPVTFAVALIADPLFVDPKHRDFRLRPGSPAAKIGFQPIDPASTAGVRQEPAWRELAGRVEFPPVYQPEAERSERP